MYWWLHNYGQPVLQVWYDVPLDGRSASMQVDAHAQSVLDPDWQRVWQRQRARRADAIVQDADGYRIIELRSSADAQTVGEMAIYQQLARAEHPGLTWLPSVLVARLLKPGVGEAIAALGAHIYVAPENLYDPTAIEIGRAHV